MNRVTELEIIAATLEEPARALLRAAIVAQRQGRLSAAANVAADLVAKRPLLRWAALLLALEHAEWKLAGAVAIATPASRFEGLEERWGPIGVRVFPAGEVLQVEVRPAGAGLELHVVAAAPASEEATRALHVLRRALHEHLGCAVIMAAREGQR